MRCTNLLEHPSTWRIREMDFSSPSSSSGDRMSKNQMMNEVRNQVAMATAQELIQVTCYIFNTAATSILHYCVVWGVDVCEYAKATF